MHVNAAAGTLSLIHQYPNPSSNQPIPALHCNPFPFKSSNFNFSVRASKVVSVSDREKSNGMDDQVEQLGSDGGATGPPVAAAEEPCIEIGPEFKQSGVTAEDWRNALSKVVPAVVVIRTTSCRTFDTELAGSASATGFVVDKKRGIILTNRHVVKPGS